MSPPCAVAIEQLCCTVGGRVTLELSHLEIHAGERVAIVGHNGAGKSTLLRCVSGFTMPNAGSIDVLGHRVSAALHPQALRELRMAVGQVLQGVHLVPRLSALENAMVGALGRMTGWTACRSWARLYRPADVAQAEQALAAVGLADRAQTRADRLSGGERQKLAIARLLMQRPRLILADEPTASLDPTAAQEVCELLVKAAAGATLITVVHNPALLPLLADRVIGLRGGRLWFDREVGSVDVAALEALYRPAPQAATSSPPPADSTPPNVYPLQRARRLP